MKILYIITQADGGGAQKYVLALAKHFNGAIAAGTENTKLFDEAEKAGLLTFPLKHLKRNISLWHDLAAVWEIRQLIKTFQPDIVHLNSSKAGILGSFATIGTKTKTIFTAHGFVFNEPLPKATKAFYLALEKVASDYRDHIITVSDADKESALQNKLIDQKKISTIHNGLPLIDFLSRDEARIKLGLDQSRFIFGTVAGFYKTKGLDTLIEAISIIPKETLSAAQFVIIGDGPEKEDLRLKIKDLKLEESVKILGKIDNAATYLKAFDVFVLPSRKEGFPYTLLEAMQASLPILATNVGGNSEAIGDAGVLIQPDKPDVLASFLASLLSGLKQGNTNFLDLSKKALERSKLFTEEKMLEETEKIYQKVLSIKY